MSFESLTFLYCTTCCPQLIELVDCGRELIQRLRQFVQHCSLYSCSCLYMAAWKAAVLLPWLQLDCSSISWRSSWECVSPPSEFLQHSNLNTFLLSAVAIDSTVCVGVFFPCLHDNSWTAALSLIKFCTNMCLDNRSKPRQFPGCYSKLLLYNCCYYWLLLGYDRIDCCYADYSVFFQLPVCDTGRSLIIYSNLWWKLSETKSDLSDGTGAELNAVELGSLRTLCELNWIKVNCQFVLHDSELGSS